MWSKLGLASLKHISRKHLVILYNIAILHIFLLCVNDIVECKSKKDLESGGGLQGVEVDVVSVKWCCPNGLHCICVIIYTVLFVASITCVIIYTVLFVASITFSYFENAKNKLHLCIIIANKCLCCVSKALLLCFCAHVYIEGDSWLQNKYINTVVGNFIYISAWMLPAKL